MSDMLLFTVAKSFLISGRGVLLAPDLGENWRFVKTGSAIKLVRPDKTELLTIIRGMTLIGRRDILLGAEITKADVPVGTEVWLSELEDELEDSTLVIKSYQEFVDYVCTNNTCGHHIYRGVTDRLEHQLIPTVGRRQDYSFDDEEEILEQFKRQSHATLSKPPSNAWDWLAIAQHHGLDTRLLDWTKSPLVALYFATQPHLKAGKLIAPNENGAAVYVLHFCQYIDTVKDPDPFAYDRVGVLYPSHIVPRIVGQSGVFTIQPDPTEALNIIKDERMPDDPVKVEFDADVVAEIQEKLFRLGIREEMLFPDLDGYSRGMKINDVLGGKHYKECT
ncbi:MAG: FRG domain-containing protein [Flavobacteriales bacterium]